MTVLRLAAAIGGTTLVIVIAGLLWRRRQWRKPQAIRITEKRYAEMLDKDTH